MAFEQIIGHQKIKQILEDTIKNNNILHSYLFCGQEGIGKLLIAKEFAKQILCQNIETAPCGKCKSCIEFASESHPDFELIEPDGNAVKIEQIRYMNNKINEKPITSSKKVYIINDSDKMTKEAQNALLKTLEEPPEYAVIIIVCRQESAMLTTIKSRCTKIEFQNLTKQELKTYFENTGKSISDEILSLADGSITKAEKRIPKQEIYTKLKWLLDNLENIDKLDMLKQSFIYDEKEDIQDLLETANSILFQIAKEKLQYLNCINIIEQTKRNLKANANFDMCIDNMLLSLWEELNEKHSRH